MGVRRRRSVAEILGDRSGARQDIEIRSVWVSRAATVCGIERRAGSVREDLVIEGDAAERVRAGEIRATERHRDLIRAADNKVAAGADEGRWRRQTTESK